MNKCRVVKPWIEFFDPNGAHPEIQVAAWRAKYETVFEVWEGSPNDRPILPETVKDFWERYAAEQFAEEVANDCSGPIEEVRICVCDTATGVITQWEVPIEYQNPTACDAEQVG